MPKDPTQYDRLTYQYKRDMEPCGKPVCVYGWGTYTSGVLKGQPMKQFLDCYEDEEAALAAHPTAKSSSHWTEPQVNLNHLPDEDTPCAGGMYPDDID
ncbi:MAG TPA: hypothetical protein VF797_04875 [Noviherbaspirillum sp.]